MVNTATVVVMVTLAPPQTRDEVDHQFPIFLASSGRHRAGDGVSRTALTHVHARYCSFMNCATVTDDAPVYYARAHYLYCTYVYLGLYSSVRAMHIKGPQSPVDGGRSSQWLTFRPFAGAG